MFALETPARVWQRVKALEKQGHDLDELPSLPAFDASTESGDSTGFDSPRAAAKRTIPQSPAAAAANGKENRAESATPLARVYSPVISINSATTERAGIRASPAGRNFSGGRPSNNNKNATKGSNLGIGLPAPDLSLPNQVSVSASSLHDISLESPSDSSSTSSQSLGQEHPRAYSAAQRRASPIPEVTEPVDESSDESRSEAGRQPSRWRTASHNQRLPSLSYSAASSLPSTADALRSPAQQFEDERHISVVDEDHDSANFSNDQSEDATDLHSRRISPVKVQTQAPAEDESYASPRFGRDYQSNLAPGHQTATPQQSPLSNSQSPSAFATPRPGQPGSDIERRKGHLLATLQLTAVRSQSRAKLKKGTPYPKRNFSTNDSDEASSVGVGSSGTETTSNDLNPYPNANASLPLGNAPAARFNGAKLNNYLHNLNTHLTTENSNLVAELDQARAEINRLQRPGSQSPGGEVDRLVQQELKAEVDRLVSQISEREQEVNTLRAKLLQEQEAAAQNHGDNTQLVEQADSLRSLQKENFELRDKLTAAQEEHASAIAGWQHRTDELLIQLEEKDQELESANDAIDVQQEEFAEKMKQLEEETCLVVEELEQKSQMAITDVERLESEREAIEEDARRQINLLEEEIGRHQQEIERLHQEKPLQSSSSRHQATAQEANTRADTLAAEVQQLQSALNDRNAELSNIQSTLKARTQELENQLASALDSVRQRSVNGRQSTSETNQRVANLEFELQSHKADNHHLQTKLGETLERNQEIETELRSDLEEARLEIERLELLHGADLGQTAQGDLKDIEIATLARAKAELESRVNSLRKQINLMADLDNSNAPATPDKSLPFRTILGIPTPRTPGFYLSKSSNASTLGEGVSMMDQMATLERQIKELRIQLEQVNRQLDDKLAKLQRSDRDHSTTRKQLAAARSRVTELENMLSDSGVTLTPQTKREIQTLQRDIQHVKETANSLGDDIQTARRQSQGHSNGKLLYTKEETRTLLALVQHLKARVTRESNLRSSLVFQKQYMAQLSQTSKSRSRSRSPSPKRRSYSRSVSPVRRKGSRSPSPARGRPRTRSLSRSRSRSRSFSPVAESTIGIKHLTRNIRPAHLDEIFGVYGKIRFVDLPTNPRSGLHRGNATITFTTAAAADKAVAHMDRGQIDGVSVAVDFERRRMRSFSPPPVRRGGPVGGFRRSPPPGRRPAARSRSPVGRRSRTPPRRRRSVSSSDYSRSRSRSPPRKNTGNNGRDAPRGGFRRPSPSYGSRRSPPPRR